MCQLMLCVCLCTGVYPDCELCGPCYDGIGARMDSLASAVQQRYLDTVDFWWRNYRQ